MLPCQLVQGLQCLPPDATAGCVQDAQQVDVVVVVGADPQVADDILYLLALEKAGAAADGVGDVGRKEGLLNGAALGVGPHQHPEVVVAAPLRHADPLDGLRDEVRLRRLVLRQEDFDGAARPVPRPQGLILAVGVVGDDPVGGGQNCFRGAVVLLQPDFPHVGKVPLEHADVLVVGSPPGIDGLVVVAYHRHIPVRQQVHHLVLLDGGVLEFVHHDVLVAAAVLLQHVGMLPEQADWQGNQVVKVHGIVQLQSPLVLLVQLLVLAVAPHLWIWVVPSPSSCLYIGKKIAHGVHVQGIGGKAQLPSCLLDELVSVGLVVDGEIAPPSQPFDVLPQDLHPEGMEGGHGEVLELPSRLLLHPLLHLLGRLVGEGEGKDLALGDALVQHVCDAVGDDPGLAASRTCDDEQRPLGGGDRLELLLI